MTHMPMREQSPPAVESKKQQSLSPYWLDAEVKNDCERKVRSSKMLGLVNIKQNPPYEIEKKNK